jgi:hypothetical protein
MFRQRNSQQRNQNRTIFGHVPGMQGWEVHEADIRRNRRLNDGYTAEVGIVEGPFDTSNRFNDEEDEKDTTYGPQRPRYLGRPSRIRYDPRRASEVHVYRDPITSEQALDYHNDLVIQRRNNIMDVNNQIRRLGSMLREGRADYSGTAGRQLNREIQRMRTIPILYDFRRDNTNEEKTN